MSIGEILGVIVALFVFTSLTITIISNIELLLATKSYGAEDSSAMTEPHDLRSFNQTILTIERKHLVAYLATSSEQKSLGLSVMDNLTEDHTMLFVYGNEGQHPFWMKDMKFPIDIMWIDSNQRVVHIERSLAPCDPNKNCTIYSPEVDSLYVLETVANYTVKYDINIGTPISIGNSGRLNGGESLPCQDCPIEPSEPYLKNTDSVPLKPAYVGQQMIIATSIQQKTEATESSEFVTMIEARDSAGVTQFLAWQKSSLSAEQYTEIGALWAPMEPGKYELRTFIISDLENPVILSSVKSSVWNIFE